MIHIDRITKCHIECVGAFMNRFAGLFKIEAFRGHELPNGKVLEIAGTRHVLSPWNHNVITDIGLDMIGSGGGFLSYCHLGTGTNIETAGDTALQAFERKNDTIQSSSTTAQGTAPYYGSKTIVYRFDPPGSNKVYAEIGISKQTTTGNLFSRTRIKDGGGSNTTISVLANEYLDVTYQFRNYPDALTLEEYIVDAYDIDFLASQVTASGIWGLYLGGELTAVGGANHEWRAYSSNATIGSVTELPIAAQNSQEFGISVGSYSSTTYNKNITYTAGLNNANVTGGIGGAYFKTKYSQYQAIFVPVIPKNATKELSITLNYAWARAAIP